MDRMHSIPPPANQQDPGSIQPRAEDLLERLHLAHRRGRVDLVRRLAADLASAGFGVRTYELAAASRPGGRP